MMDYNPKDENDRPEVERPLADEWVDVEEYVDAELRDRPRRMRLGRRCGGCARILC
jgi:hypothetical protein